MADALYRAARWSAYASGGSRVLLRLHDCGGIVETDAVTVRILSVCRGARPLQGHVTSIAMSLGVTEETARQMVDAGILAACTVGPTPDAEDRDSTARIDCIGVPTRERPERLAQWIVEAASHLARHGRSVDIIIADSSSDPSMSWRIERQAVDAFGSPVSVAYMGRPQRQLLIDRLSTSPHERRLVEWATAGPQIGANRNVLLLTSAGRSILMMDDDVRWTSWRTERYRHRLLVAGHADSHAVGFFETRADVLSTSELTSIDVDILGDHETLLGARLSSLSITDVVAEDACHHMLDHMASRDGAWVRATVGGIVGDSGMQCSYSSLFADETRRKAFYADPTLFRRALGYRESYRIADNFVVTHAPWCMGGCLGVCNSEPTPPFLPFGRNEDGVFGALLVSLNPNALLGYIPSGVLHDSARPPEMMAGSIPSATSTRAADVIREWIQSDVFAVSLCAPDRRGAAVARSFRELSVLSVDDFRELVTRTVLGVRAGQLQAISSHEEGGAPAHWRAAADRFRHALHDSLQRAMFFCPVEFEGPDLDARFAAFQTALGRFGELIEFWPELWTRARALDLAGLRIASDKR